MFLDLKKYLFICFFLFTSTIQASLKNLAKELIRENGSLQRAKINSEISILNYKSLKLTKTWNLNYDYNYSDSSLKNSLTLLSSPLARKSHVLSLSKDFEFGGTLSFNNTLGKYDYQNSDAYYGFNQGLTYQQNLGRNLLGRTFKKKLKIVKEESLISFLDYEEKVQRSLLSLTDYYIESALNLSLVELQTEGKTRALERLKLIQRRVKDGLREKVDLLQARSSFLDQDEKIKSARANLEASLEKLSSAVHRKVKKQEIDNFRSIKAKQERIPKGKVVDNKNFIILDKRKKILKTEYNKTEDSLIPTIVLSLGYQTNEFDSHKGKSLDNGFLLGNRKRDEKKIALSASWPIGSSRSKIEKSKAYLRLKSAENFKKKKELSLKQTEKSLKEQVKIIEKNIKSVRKRLALSRRTLKEYNKLYKRGRADLDQVIRAEESLIRTEINHVNYIARRKKLIYGLSYLFGNFRNYLLEDK